MQGSRAVRAAVAGLVAAVTVSGCAFVTRVSESTSATSSQPTTASGGSYATSVSSDGRFVAFESTAPDVLPGDTNGVSDVFVRDRSSGAVERASVSSSEAQGNATSYAPRISPDGRFVTFESSASLVSADTNGLSDVYVRDRQVGTTVLASPGVGGAPANGVSYLPSLSADGRYVAFHSAANNLVAGDTNGLVDVFVRDLQAGTTTRVSVGAGGAQATGGASNLARISADGRYVAFSSLATNLVSGDTNGTIDVFVRDRQAGTTSRVSVTNGGAQVTAGSDEPAISADGRYVAFTSFGTNLVPVDTNASLDVFVRDRQAGTTTRVSLLTGTGQADGPSSLGAISADGRYVSFTSSANNLAPEGSTAVPLVYRRDRTTGTTVLVSRNKGNGQVQDDTGYSSISADGNVIGFTSLDSQVAPTDTNGQYDVFVRTVSTGATDVVSRYMSKQGNAGSASIDVSADGRYAVFASHASDLVPGDTNGQTDIFRRDLVTGATTRVSVGVGWQTNATSYLPRISGNGRFVVYESEATNIVGGIANGTRNIFRWDSVTGTTICVSVSGSTGAPANSVSRQADVSDDGRYVSFDSFAKNLVAINTNVGSDIYVRDVQAGVTSRVSLDTSGLDPNAGSFHSSMSPDARFVVFTSSASNLISGDTNGADDVFLRDRGTGITTRVSVTTAGQQSNSSSDDGAVSDDGRFASFASYASNLVANDTNGLEDAFLRDRSLALTTRVDGGVGAAEANGAVEDITTAISGDGRYVVFSSDASNLVPNDTNGALDVFVYDHVKDRTSRVDTAQQLTQASFASVAAISRDGRYVGFTSAAADIVTPDVNDNLDVFVRANPVPTVTARSPMTAFRGFTSTITVTGTNFLPGVTAYFGDGITVTATSVPSEEQVQFTISVAPTAPTGSRTVIVFLTGTGPGVLTGAAAQFALNVA
jgi:hypothetical protein